MKCVSCAQNSLAASSAFSFASPHRAPRSASARHAAASGAEGAETEPRRARGYTWWTQRGHGERWRCRGRHVHHEPQTHAWSSRNDNGYSDLCPCAQRKRNMGSSPAIPTISARSTSGLRTGGTSRWPDELTKLGQCWYSLHPNLSERLQPRYQLQGVTHHCA